MAITINCWSCGEGREIEELFRSDTCSKCDADLRCCKCCRHYDAGTSNDCRETMADYVHKKERANFCEYFSAKKGGAETSTDEVDAATARLEALFKK